LSQTDSTATAQLGWLGHDDSSVVYTSRMKMDRFASWKSGRIACSALLTTCLAVAVLLPLRAQDSSGFPKGYDAVEAAPNSHRVIFENALVRVLEVTMPPPGQTEPLHHHRWPSFFLDWDTGGSPPHVRYHRADGSVVDQHRDPSPTHPGHWEVHWMKPEPMHAIETVALPQPSDERGMIRVEIKCTP